MLNAGWGTTFFDLPTPKYILWNHFRPFLIDFDFFLILIFESENRLVNPQCLLRVRNVDKNDFQYLRPYNTEELYGASQCVCAFDSLFIKT